MTTRARRMTAGGMGTGGVSVGTGVGQEGSEDMSVGAGSDLEPREISSRAPIHAPAQGTMQTATMVANRFRFMGALRSGLYA